MTIILALLATFAAPRIIEQIDPITDAHSVYAVIGNQNRHLAIGCSNAGDTSTVRVVAHFDRYVGEATPGILAGGREVLYRFDQRPPQSVLWYAHNREVVAENKPTRPIQFMLEMKGSTEINLRAATFDGDPVDMAFSYPEPTNIIDRVLAQCGFTSSGKKLPK